MKTVKVEYDAMERPAQPKLSKSIREIVERWCEVVVVERATCCEAWCGYSWFVSGFDYDMWLKTWEICHSDCIAPYNPLPITHAERQQCPWTTHLTPRFESSLGGNWTMMSSTSAIRATMETKAGQVFRQRHCNFVNHISKASTIIVGGWFCDCRYGARFGCENIVPFFVKGESTSTARTTLVMLCSLRRL